MTERNNLSGSDLATEVEISNYSYMLTLKSLFAAHPHSTVAGPPEC